MFPSSVQGINHHPGAQVQDPESLCCLFPPPLSLALHFTSFEVLNLKVNIAHIHPLLSNPTSAPFEPPLSISTLRYGKVVFWVPQATEPETRIWVLVIYFRGDLRRPRTRVGQGSERSQCSAVCVVKHCRNWSAILLASSGVHYRTHLRIIPSDRQGNWDICPPPLYLSALNGCSQGQEVLHCVKAEHATSQKAEGPQAFNAQWWI